MTMYDKRISISLTPEQKELIHAAAAATGLTMSEFVRRAVAARIDREN